jgi:hypothetical protein
VLYLPAAELGDYEEGYHTPAVVSEFHFIPNQTEEMEIAVLEEYKKCRYVCLCFVFLLDHRQAGVPRLLSLCLRSCNVVNT